MFADVAYLDFLINITCGTQVGNYLLYLLYILSFFPCGTQSGFYGFPGQLLQQIGCPMYPQDHALGLGFPTLTEAINGDSHPQHSKMLEIPGHPIKISRMTSHLEISADLRRFQVSPRNLAALPGTYTSRDLTFLKCI